MSAGEILRLAVQQGVTIATAESCTGGMVAACLTDLPGSSAMFDRGYVTYSNQAKMDMLGVSVETLDAYGAVSEQVAEEMAVGAVLRSNASVAISITGIAGPGGSEHKPEGRVCFGVATAEIIGATTHEFGPLGRDKVRQQSAGVALGLLLSHLRKMPN